MHMHFFFENWIKMICGAQKAFILQDGIPSNMFSIYHGVQQGYEISPFVLNICLEELAIQIREISNIHGVICNHKETKMV